MSEEYKSPIEIEIEALVKAHGFDAGRYDYTPNRNKLPGIQGDITNGVVKGSCMYQSNNEKIIFKRVDFPGNSWKKVCAIMGFRYNNPDDITQFTIIVNNGSIKVDLSIKTPDD